MSPAPPSDDRPRRRIPPAALGALVIIVLVGALVTAQRIGYLDTGGSALSADELEQLRTDFDGEIPDGFEAQRLAAEDGTIDPAELRYSRQATSR